MSMRERREFAHLIADHLAESMALLFDNDQVDLAGRFRAACQAKGYTVVAVEPATAGRKEVTVWSPGGDLITVSVMFGNLVS